MTINEINYAKWRLDLMKLSKKEINQFYNELKEKAALSGYKSVGNSLYRFSSNNIVSVDYLIIDNDTLHYRISLKKRSYDDYFWDIMQMPENKDGKETLRIEGAFASPSLCLKSDDIAIESNSDVIKSFIDEVNKLVDEFLEKNEDVSRYIIANQDEINDDILTSLAYIDLNQLDLAKDLAITEIEDDEIGWFENKGKGYFEWLLEYYD